MKDLLLNNLHQIKHKFLFYFNLMHKKKQSKKKIGIIFYKY